MGGVGKVPGICSDIKHSVFQQLVQMETKSRSKLEEERKGTTKLMEELEARVARFADQVEK